MSKIDLNKDKFKAPYKVPEDYFDKLTSNIQERIAQPTPERVVEIQWKWALAPALVFMLAIGLYFFAGDSAPNMDQLLADVTDEQIEAYLELNDVSEYELAMLLDYSDAATETDDFLEGIEINTDDLEMLIIDINDIEQNIGS